MVLRNTTGIHHHVPLLGCALKPLPVLPYILLEPIKLHVVVGVAKEAAIHGEQREAACVAHTLCNLPDAASTLWSIVVLHFGQPGPLGTCSSEL